jgi:ABC-type maltose transport system permease subunit
MDDSARIDGCTILQRLIFVVLPVAAPRIMVVGFVSFVSSGCPRPCSFAGVR